MIVKYSNGHSALYAFDLDLRNRIDRIIIHRKVPIRTLLFFINLERIDYWQRKMLIEEIRRKLGISLRNKSIVLLMSRRNGVNSNFHIDKYWDNLINEFVHRSLDLETEMWKLSTLGGAFSAVGFFDEQFVKRALQVSIRQLQIARMLGNEIFVARCHLYISLGLAQKKHFQAATKIVRQVWNEAKNMNSDLLKNCVQGVWITIKWIWAKDKNALFCAN